MKIILKTDHFNKDHRPWYALITINSFVYDFMRSKQSLFRSLRETTDESILFLPYNCHDTISVKIFIDAGNEDDPYVMKDTYDFTSFQKLEPGQSWIAPDDFEASGADIMGCNSVYMHVYHNSFVFEAHGKRSDYSFGTAEIHDEDFDSWACLFVKPETSPKGREDFNVKVDKILDTYGEAGFKRLLLKEGAKSDTADRYTLRAFEVWLNARETESGFLVVPKVAFHEDRVLLYWENGDHYLEMEIIPGEPKVELLYHNHATGEYFGEDWDDQLHTSIPKKMLEKFEKYATRPKEHVLSAITA